MNKIDYERLVEIREEMVNLLNEATTLIRHSGSKDLYQQAKAYWIGHMDTALGEGNYMDKYDYTFAKTLKDLYVDEEEEYEDDEDCF